MKTKTEIMLTSNMEDYLEAIRNLEKSNRVARVKDIAKTLKVKMPSVTGALKVLREKGLINYEKNSFIILTEEGLEISKEILTKHKTLARFLETILLIGPNERVQDMACKMEHAIDCDTAQRMTRMIDLFETNMIGSGKMSPEAWKEHIEGKAD